MFPIVLLPPVVALAELVGTVVVTTLAARAASDLYDSVTNHSNSGSGSSHPIQVFTSVPTLIRPPDRHRFALKIDTKQLPLLAETDAGERQLLADCSQ